MAAHFTYDFESVTHIVADAVGQPGRRTFFLQARQGRRTASLILEKQQVAALASSVLQLLDELQTQHPELEPAEATGHSPRLVEPIDPAFRVGQLGLGYDEERDLMVVVAQAMPTRDEGEDEEESPVAVMDDLPRARFFATRSQMRALSEKALAAVEAGRPDCPLCGRPIDAAGHFCPRANGHAFPLAF